jgi:hypothetical protein
VDRVSTQDDGKQDDSEGGQVSEVSTLEGADEPIMPDQAVAGAPDAESGDVEEGRAGPNARTGKDAGDPPR